MSVNVSISRLREARNISKVDKIITNNPSDDNETSGSTTWVPEQDAYNYVNADTLDVSENGTYKPEEDGSYYNVVKVEVEGGESSGDSAELIDEKVIKENGTFYAIDDAKNEDSKTAAYEDVKVQVPLAAKVITANGQYDATDDISAEGDPVQGYSSVEVKVAGVGGAGRKINKTIKANGLYKAEDEIVGEDEGPIEGYSQVDVALPMVRKKVKGNGTFNASDEQDANGDDALAYSEVEVGVEILQPAFDFVMNIDHKKNRFSLPFAISIRDTYSSEYGDYEKQHAPTATFRNAIIQPIGYTGASNDISSAGGIGFGDSWFKYGNFNFSEFFVPSYGRKTNRWNENAANSIYDSYKTNGYANEECQMRVIDLQKGEQKYIFSGKFKVQGNTFDMANYNSLRRGANSWRVKGVAFNSGYYYSFVVTVKVPNA